jgi:alpha-1,3-mannosyltransferase
LYRLVQNSKRHQTKDCKLLKVLHITTDFVPGTGGLERFVRDLAVHSRTIEVDPSVLCLNKIAGNPNPLSSSDRVDDIPVQRLSHLDWKYYKPVLLPLNKLRSADILHVHGIGAMLDFATMTKWIHHRPIILSTHGGIFHNENLARIKNAYFGLVRRLFLPGVNRIVACGHADRELFAEHGVTETTTVDNGIDLSAFLKPIGCERVARRMLFVGRIAPNKCLHHLIRTLAEIRLRGIDATLRIIGPDRYQLNQGLKQLGEDMGVGDAVTIAGEVSEKDLPGEYQQADLFVSASRHEGFGISAVEAMAGGAIPLLNDIPAFAYLLKTNGETSTGALCDFSNPSSSADVAISLLSSDREHVRNAARDRAADFSWDRLMPRWREIYDSVLAQTDR